MDETVIRTILWVAAAVVAAPILGALLMGIDRRVTARMQRRVGPPLLQPFYDVLKLLRKHAIVLNRVQILYVYMHLGFMVLVVVLLALQQDLLMVLFAHAFSTIALILGGMSVRSPYSRIGSQRKIMQMLAYEPVLVLIVVALYLLGRNSIAAGTAEGFLPGFRVSDAAALVAATGRPLLWSMPLLFAALWLAVAIKMEKSPFDVATSHHAHQELVKGITLEYSGPFLAIIEVTHFMEAGVLFAILALFWSTNLWIGAGIASVSFFGLVLLDNLMARLTTMWMVKFMWSIALVLAVSNVIWLYV
jgi:ech hydrogenase subunit B